MNPLKQLFGQTAVYGLSSVIARVLNFLLVPLYTRVFVDAAEYGVVNELYAYTAFLIIVLTYGMETAFFRFSSKNSDSDQVFSTTLISLIFTSLLFVIVVILFYPAVAKVLQYEDQSVFILLLGLILSTDAVAAIPFARLRYRNQAGRFAIIKIINISVNIFFNLLFLVFIPWFQKNGYNNAVFELIYHSEFRVGYVFVSNLIASVITLALFAGDFLKIKFAFSALLLKSMLKYSFPLLIAGLAGAVNEVIDRVMLKFRLPDHFDSMEQIGIYGANVKIAVFMLLFIQMFRYASEPFFFSQEKKSSSRDIYASVLYYFTLAGMFIFLIISLYLDQFKNIIGSSYHEGVIIVPVVLFANLLLGIYYNISVWYKLMEKTYFGACFAISGAIVTLVINYFFIPRYGYLASAWGHVGAYSIMVVMAFLAGRKYYKIPYNLKMILFYIVFGTGLYIFTLFLSIEESFLKILVNTFVLLIYAATVGFIERKTILELVKKDN